MVAHPFKYQKSGGRSRQISVGAWMHPHLHHRFQTCNPTKSPERDGAWVTETRCGGTRLSSQVCRQWGQKFKVILSHNARVIIYSNFLFWVYHLNNFNNSSISNVKCGLCLTLPADTHTLIITSYHWGFVTFLRHVMPKNGLNLWFQRYGNNWL